MEKYYITTAIVYASSRPHIGNVYEIVLADALARFKRLQGYDVYFQTGVDEHGQKIEANAKKRGLEPQSYVDETVAIIKKEWDILNISYDKFIRTSDPKHKKKVQAIFKRLYDQGDIYLGKYEGLYCTPCESFFTEAELIDGNCPDCNRPVIKVSEDAYFLNLKKYVKQLKEHIEQNPDFIQPESRKNEMVNNFLKPGLQDLCVSRKIKWGIPVSFDEEQIIYVWIDALSNYITFIDYEPVKESGPLFNRYWPADLHVIGKDIMRFHAIYWPIILIALKEELPKKILGHSWLLSEDTKMSKSKGNTLYATDLATEFGVDAVRFYLLHEMSLNNDGNITKDLLIDKTNSELANNLGNLLNRTLNMVNQYFDGVIPKPGKQKDLIDESLVAEVNKALLDVERKMADCLVSEAVAIIFRIFKRANKYIEEKTPWLLAKDNNDKEQLQTVIYNLVETLRWGAVLLQSFMPETADKIFYQLNTDQKEWHTLTNFNVYKFKGKINEPKPLFLRIEKK